MILNKLQMEKQPQNKIDAAQVMVDRLQQKMAGNNVGGLGRSRKSLSLGVTDVQDKLPVGALLLEYIRYNHQLG